MKAILLAAGYGTRLYPLTKNTAKPLLPVAGRPIIDYLIDALETVGSIEEVYVVSNHRFFDQFKTWAKELASKKETRLTLHVLDDGTTTNENRLGAVADIELALKEAGLLDGRDERAKPREHESESVYGSGSVYGSEHEPEHKHEPEQKRVEPQEPSLAANDEVLVLAGDNLFDFSLEEWAKDFALRPEADASITVNELTDISRLRRTGVATLDDDGWVSAFHEKPESPQSHWAVPPFYLYRPQAYRLIPEYLAAGHNPDAPGHFIEWLVSRRRVFAYPFRGVRYDIGTPESYEVTQRIFEARSS